MAAILSGFADPVFDTQSVFRQLMNAIAYPGRPVTLPCRLEAPAPLNAATVALCLSLIDFETPLWLDSAASGGTALEHLRFHCGMPVASAPGEARFAVIADPQSMPGLATFNIGDEQYPDRSTTLIVEVPSFSSGPRMRWTGPGIKHSAVTTIVGLRDDFWSDWSLNRELYPQGVDVFFSCGDQLIGLPRAIEVVA